MYVQLDLSLCFWKIMGFPRTPPISLHLWLPAYSVMSDSLPAHALWPARLLCVWNFPGKNTGVGCHFFSRGSSRPMDQTCVSCTSCIGRLIIYHCITWEAQVKYGWPLTQYDLYVLIRRGKRQREENTT